MCLQVTPGVSQTHQNPSGFPLRRLLGLLRLELRLQLRDALRGLLRGLAHAVRVALAVAPPALHVVVSCVLFGKLMRLLMVLLSFL